MPPSPTGKPRRRPGPRRAALLGVGVLVCAGAAAYALSLRSPKAIGGASRADVQWRMPRTVTEERAFTLRLQGGTDGHAALHTQLRTGRKAAGCPGDPPEDSRRRVLTDLPDPEQKLGRGIGDNQQFRADRSGPARLCGWLLSTSTAGDGALLARFDRPVRIEPPPATLQVRRRGTVRAGARFTVRANGVTANPGRRVLVLAVPADELNGADRTVTSPGDDAPATSPSTTPPTTTSPAVEATTPKGTATARAGREQQAACRDLRAARRSSKQPVRLEARIPAGDYLRRLKVRFPYLSVGTWNLCVQVIEADDPEPEAFQVRQIVVTESRECEQAKAAIGDRRDDLRLLRRRREVLERRVAKAHRTARAATTRRQADAARRREIASDARLTSYRMGTKAFSQLIERVTAGARQYCPDL